MSSLFGMFLFRKDLDQDELIKLICHSFRCLSESRFDRRGPCWAMLGRVGDAHNRRHVRLWQSHCWPSRAQSMRLLVGASTVCVLI
jgi:hypothetical protein